MERQFLPSGWIGTPHRSVLLFNPADSGYENGMRTRVLFFLSLLLGPPPAVGCPFHDDFLDNDSTETAPVTGGSIENRGAPAVKQIERSDQNSEEGSTEKS